MPAVTHASLGIDLACQVQQEGSLLPVSSNIQRQKFFAPKVVSWIYGSVGSESRCLQGLQSIRAGSLGGFCEKPVFVYSEKQKIPLSFISGMEVNQT